MWSAAYKCYTYLEWLRAFLFCTHKQHPPRLGTCRPSKYTVSYTRLAHCTHQPHVAHEVTCSIPSRLPLGGLSSGTRHQHSPCVCAGSRTRELSRGTLYSHTHILACSGSTRCHTHVFLQTHQAEPGRTLAPASPPRTLSACPSARGSVVVNAAFDGGRICCVRSERAAIIWKAEIRNTIYSAALWKQFPVLYNPILGQPPGAGQITIGYSLSSPGTKISRPR